MKIMSFNILCGGRGPKEWKYRIPLVVRTINNYAPDTFGVQEAHIGWMKALRASLPDYAYVGVGREDGKNGGEFSAVFYKKDKYKLVDSGTFWLSETPEKPGKGWDAACVRICSWAKLIDRKTKKEFVHFNTHLDHIGPVAMQKGAELVTIKANELCAGVPAFFTGDFNVTPDSAPCKAVKDGGFTDARDAAPITDKGYTFHGFCNPDCTPSVIDYVFFKGDVNVKEFRVIRDSIDRDIPSDHFPVIAEFDF